MAIKHSVPVYWMLSAQLQMVINVFPRSYPHSPPPLDSLTIYANISSAYSKCITESTAVNPQTIFEKIPHKRVELKYTHAWGSRSVQPKTIINCIPGFKRKKLNFPKSKLTKFPLLDPEPCSVSCLCQRLPTILFIFRPSKSNLGTWIKTLLNVEKTW